MVLPDDPVVPPLPLVVVVVLELVELHAATDIATTTAIPSAAMRVFHDAEPKAPPCRRTSYRNWPGLGGKLSSPVAHEYVTLRQKLRHVSSTAGQSVILPVVGQP